MTMLRVLSGATVCVLGAAVLAQPPVNPTPKPPEKRPVPDTPAAVEMVYVQMNTSKGDLILELDGKRAPISVANFLKYAQRKDYDGTIFHRIAPGFVIQGGGRTPDLKERPSDAPIENEWTNGLKNNRGTIAMARDAAPDTATREFYFNLKDNSQLDTARESTGNAGYAVFGKIIAGLDVMDAIAAVKTRDVSEDLKGVPDEPVLIVKVVQITKEEADKAAKRDTEAPTGDRPQPKPKPSEPPKPGK